MQNIQTIALEAMAQGPFNFNATNIVGATTYQITNGTNGPINLSSLGADVKSISIDKVNSTEMTNLQCSSDSIDINIGAATTAGGNGANLRICFQKQIEAGYHNIGVGM